MCSDCFEEQCKCEYCVEYRHQQACPVCGHLVFLDCCQGF